MPEKLWSAFYRVGEELGGVMLPSSFWFWYAGMLETQVGVERSYNLAGKTQPLPLRYLYINDV